MRVRSASFIIFIAVSLSAVSMLHAEDVAPSSAEEWQQIISEEGLFAIEMPALPTFKTRVREYTVGEIRENAYELEGKDSEFTAEYTDLPGFVVIFGQGIIYRMAKRNFLRESHASEIDFEDFDLGPLEGKELSFEIEKKGKAPARTGRARFVLAGKRLYVIVAAAEDGAPAMDSIDRFLDSFEIQAYFLKRKAHKYHEMQKESLSPKPAELVPREVATEAKSPTD